MSALTATPSAATPASARRDLAALLVNAARQFPRHEVICLDARGDARRQTYPELLAEAAQILGGLRAAGLVAGQKVLFQFEHNHDFIPAFWACVLGGFVPVPVTIAPTYEQPHSILAKLKNAWQLLGQPRVLTGEALAPRLRSFAQRENLHGFRVETIETLRTSAPARDIHSNDPADLALLLLTSGSTGLPKAVQQTHGNLSSWAASVATACAFTAADVSINWMPLDHVGGIVMFHLRDVALGCTQIHAPTEPVLQRPLVWLDWIERFRATITWAPNFAYGLVNDQAAEIAKGHWDLSSMRFILNGGEAIVSKTARRFLALLEPHALPATAMRPAWGMSETCSGVTYSRRFTLATTTDEAPFVQVGEAIPGIELRIVDTQDRPVAAGRIGRLQIRGISVTPGYLDNPAANQAAFTPDGWFITGDLGLLADGQLSITGREKDVIIINGVNFYSHELEAVVEEVPGVEVSFTAACAIRRPGEDTDRIAIFFVTTAEAAARLPELAKTLRQTVARKEGVTPDYLVPLTRADIPKTAIGKIQRTQLRDQFEKGAFAEALARTTPTPDFFTPVWLPIAAAPAEPNATAAPGDKPAASASPADVKALPLRGVLLFADTSGLAAQLAAQLSATGVPSLLVHAGTQFAAPEAGAWQLNPAQPQDYALLVAALNRLQFPVSHIVHAWTYPAAVLLEHTAASLHDAQATGAFSLLHLLQAWPTPAENAPALRLLVATSRLHSLRADETPDLAKAPLSGLVRTLPHEYPWLHATLLDLPGRELTSDLGHLQRELTLPALSEVLVRDGLRHQLSLHRQEPAPTGTITASDNTNASTAAASLPAIRFRTGGFYVLTGGLGGIGQVVSLALARRYQARLLLLARTPLASDPADPQVLAIQALTQAGATVRHAGGDLTDPAFVAEAVAAAATAWGQPPDGFLHLAGRNRETPLKAEWADAFWDIVQPKLVLGWTLHQVARRYPGAWMVHFSSVLGHFGALGAGAYTAANAALGPLVQLQRSQGIAAQTLLWSLWRDTGMARGFAADAAMRVRGYLAIEPTAGPDLLEAALRLPASAVLIGLDGENRLLRRHLDPGSQPATASSGPGYVEPRTPTERALVRMWEQILEVPRVGIEDNFFELGGRSLLAARLFARIQRELGQQLPLATLFHAPTIAALARLISTDATAAPAPLPCLLPLQTQGNLPPFFCIPGGGSDAIVFQDLSAALGPQQPFYGLQTRGLDATLIEPPYPSVQEVAAEFVTAIRKVQPSGPYYLGGHCFGCLLAWEVAVQLRAQGAAIGLLALLDPIVSNVFSGEILGRERLRYHLGKFLRLSLGGKLLYFVEKVRNFSRTLIVRQRISQSYDLARSMHERYTLPNADLPVLVYLADDSFFNLTPATDPRRYYEKIATHGVSYHSVPGDHHAILHPPGIGALATHLAASLQTRQAALTPNPALTSS